MVVDTFSKDVKDTKDKIVYCICPHCKSSRKKLDGKWTIIKRGRERNGLTRYKCQKCNKWFNEKNGYAMDWYER